MFAVVQGLFEYFGLANFTGLTAADFLVYWLQVLVAFGFVYLIIMGFWGVLRSMVTRRWHF